MAEQVDAMAYHLRRESDGAGNSGSYVLLRHDPNDPFKTEEYHNRPRVGWCARVGTPQNYWTTSPIVKIIKDTESYVRFKTRDGSIYMWWDY